MSDYRRVAPVYARHRQAHPAVLQRLVRSVSAAASVLEVGCGTGNYIVPLAEQTGGACWGVDLAPEMLAVARARTAQVRFLPGRAEALGLPAGQFDLLFTVDVIHYVQDRPRFFREARRVLKPGGALCTVTESPELIRQRQPLSAYFPETVAAELARHPPITALRAEQLAAGFQGPREEALEFPYALTDAAPYRAKAFSCLRALPEEVFRCGLARLAADLAAGPVPCVSRYLLLWAESPGPTAG